MLKAMKTVIVVGILFGVVAAHGQEDYRNRLGVQRGGAVSFEPTGPGVVFGALDPAIKKWYVPQELYTDYGWHQWEYSNYARDTYERYVNTTREGDYFYDVYGNFTTHGWLIYDWRQDQPQPLGSGIFQSTRFNTWFNAVTISGDSQGQYNYSITVGDRIRTTLTPMTFSKPDFNGVQIDFASDKYAATILASRISEPIRGSSQGTGGSTEPITQTNTTSMFGGRATFQVGDFITLGTTLIDARNANSTLDLFDGDMVAGSLTAGQSTTPLTAIAVILSDDSPADGEGGAALFSHEVRIVSRDFDTGKETSFSLQQVVRPGSEWPVIFGGFRRPGFLAADGPERIIVNYDFNDPAYIGPDPTTIVGVDFDYVVANDFKIELWSDRQTGQRAVPAAPLTGEVIDNSQPAFVVLRRAEGNVQDISNLQRVTFDYGLPTANLIGGFTVEGVDVVGFDFYGEWDHNTRYSQYPNAALFNESKKHKISSESSDAWFFNVSRDVFPYFLYGEAYSIDEAYSTTAFLVNANGDVQYDNSQRHLYEFVDDNDDQDRFPDWVRFGTINDRAIYPGWDQNNDFISDFNQNDNATVGNVTPDYEEPFLRYNVDRPEFLFGIDLNNNNWIDRFENDDEPDYPYRTDRRGYNIYGGAFVTPHAKVTLGLLDEESLATDGRNRATYGLVIYDRDLPRGRVRVFDMLKRVEDNIADDRREMTPHLDVNSLAIVNDLLPARDTWVNSAYVQFDYRPFEKVNLVNKFKYDLYAQQGDAFRRRERGPALEETTYLLGLINKVDYTREVAGLILQPKLKSE